MSDRMSPVYPGHPLVILACIIDVYPSPSAALAPAGRNAHHCLGNTEIPGAGSHVWEAIDLVEMLVEGASADEVIESAARRWRSLCETHYVDRIEPGQEQADKFADGIRATAEEWARVGKVGRA